MYTFDGGIMQSVNTTELRNHLSRYLAHVVGGDEIQITSHGKIIARISPAQDPRVEAQALLRQWRKTCTIGDIVSPLDEDWDADQ